MIINGREVVSGNMLIYCNGDSFVAGVELGDDILPDYPGLTPFPMNAYIEQAANKAWLAKTYDKKHEYGKARDDQTKKLTELEFGRAFPNKVKNLTGHEVINRALGGASMDRIVRTTICDLQAARQKDPTGPMMAFIGTTHPMRWEIPIKANDGFDLHGHPMDWTCISTTYSKPNDEYNIREMIKLKVLSETYYHALVNAYKNILLVQNFCARKNIHVYWVATHDNLLTDFPIDSYYEDRSDLKLLKEAAGLFYEINMKQLIIDKFGNKPVLCPGGHFAENVHNETAKVIVDIIKGLNLA